MPGSARTVQQGVSLVHTPRPGRQRQRGVKRPYVGLRLPQHLADHIDAKVEQGVKKTDAILDLIQLGKDLEEAMGSDFWELERLAKVEGVMPGTLLGRIAKASLNKRK